MLNTKLRNKGNALLTPYFIWGVLIGFLVENSRLIIRGKGSLDVLSAVWSILTFRTSYLASWFLGALFFVYCIEFLISLFFRHCKHKPLHNILWICSHFFMLVLGYSLAGSTAASYFRFSIVLVSCFFFGLGLCIKQIIRKLEILPVGYRVSLCLISLLAGMVLCFLNTKVTYSNQSYGNLFLHTASASFSILGLFLTFRLLYEKEIATPVKHFLEHFGKHSIIVLLTHIIFLYGIRIIETLLNMEIHTFPSSIAFILLVAAEYLTIKRMPRKLLWTFGI